MFRNLALLAVVASAIAVAPVRADDVTGVDQLLCSPVAIQQCPMGGDCVPGEPWDLELPPFVELDLAAKTFHSTAASGEARTTPIRSVERDGALVILQGYEMGRAFSGIVSQPSGVITLSITLDDRVVVVFGACTPREATR